MDAKIGKRLQRAVIINKKNSCIKKDATKPASAETGIKYITTAKPKIPLLSCSFCNVV